MDSEAIRIRVHVNVPPAEIFQALTDAARLRAWFAEHAEVALHEGKYEFWGRYTPDGERGRQRLLESDQDRRLSFAWSLGGAERRVDLTLEPEQPDGTLLTLSHAYLSTDGFDMAELTDFWFLAAGNLANHVEGRSLASLHDFSRTCAGQARSEIIIDASSQQVFASLVEPVQLDRWIADKAHVEPWVGGRYDLGWGGPSRIVEFEPGRVLAYSWHDDGSPDSVDSVVRWQLQDAGGKTRVIVLHSGFADPRAADGYQLGWQAFLVQLQRMHELADTWCKITW